MASPPSPSERKVPMRVIVCGVHRTGTLSTQAALHQLGFHQCYHMSTVPQKPTTDPLLWVDALESKFGDRRPFTLADWDRLLSTSQAVTDIPGSLFGPELAELYPEAKVVIQTRDPEAWHESAMKTSQKYIKRQPLLMKAQMMLFGVLDVESRNMGRLFATLTRLVLPFDYASEKERALKWYNDIYDEFRTRIPKERWIEWKVQDGWGPLCEHLGVPIPMVKDGITGEMVEAPFPNTNDRGNFGNRMAKMMAGRRARAMERIWGLLGRGAVVGLVGYGWWLIYKMRLGVRLR